MKAGDDAIISGILIKRWKKFRIDSRPEVSMCIVANSIQIRNFQKSKKEMRKIYFQNLIVNIFFFDLQKMLVLTRRTY